MNKLLGMLAFVRVVEHGGFTLAARHLGVSVSAVAKTVARLEEELGVQLLVRTTRKIAVTDFGREFYTRCTRILNEIEDAEASLKRAQKTPQGRLVMSTPVSFGRVTLLPRLAEFNERYPDISLELRLIDRDDPINLIEEGLDLAVHVGELSDSRLVTRLLNRGPRVCVASPAYLKRHGTPKTPQDLEHHNCIVNYPGPVWVFKMGSRRIEIVARGNLTVNIGDAMREAALLGLGIAQTNWWTFRHDIAAGRLVPILEEYAMEGRPISILYPPTRHVPLKVRVMIDLLVEITRMPEPGKKDSAPERALRDASAPRRTKASG